MNDELVVRCTRVGLNYAIKHYIFLIDKILGHLVGQSLNYRAVDGGAVGQPFGLLLKHTYICMFCLPRVFVRVVILLSFFLSLPSVLLFWSLQTEAKKKEHKKWVTVLYTLTTTGTKPN